MDKEEPNFNIWGEISDSNMVLEVAKVEQKYARVILRETSHETKNKCLRLVVPLEFGTFYDVISMVYKSVNHGKLWSFCLLDYSQQLIENRVFLNLF